MQAKENYDFHKFEKKNKLIKIILQDFFKY